MDIFQTSGYNLLRGYIYNTCFVCHSGRICHLMRMFSYLPVQWFIFSTGIPWGKWSPDPGSVFVLPYPLNCEKPSTLMMLMLCTYYSLIDCLDIWVKSTGMPVQAGESCWVGICESSIRQILISFNLDMSELTWLEVDCGLSLSLCLHCRCRGVCVPLCVSVMDVLQMVSAPSNYAVDTGGSPAQRSLRTHTHTLTQKERVREWVRSRCFCKIYFFLNSLQ